MLRTTMQGLTRNSRTVTALVGLSIAVSTHAFQPSGYVMPATPAPALWHARARFPRVDCREIGAQEQIADACGVLQQMPPAIVAAAALEALGCGVRDWRACAARFPGAAFVFPSPGPSRAEDSQDELVHED